MAAQVGTVEVPVDVVLTGQALRLKSLELAVQHVDSHNDSFVSAATVVAFAGVFEGYLTGKSEEEQNDGRA